MNLANKELKSDLKKTKKNKKKTFSSFDQDWGWLIDLYIRWKLWDSCVTERIWSSREEQ